MTYKERLLEILGKPPDTLWTILVAQLLLWTFRRFFIAALNDDVDSPTTETWTDFLDFVKRFGPPPLDERAEWLRPEVVGSVSVSLEALDTFFHEIVADYDTAIATDNDVSLQEIALFFDAEILAALHEWAPSPFRPLFFFPRDSSEEDDLPPERFKELMAAVGEFFAFGQFAVFEEPEPAPVEVLPAILLRARHLARKKTIRIRNRAATPLRSGRHASTRRKR